MIFGIISQLIIQLLIPVYFLSRLLTSKQLTPLTRHIVVLFSVFGMFYVLISARWDITSVYLRYFWVAALIFGVVSAYRTKLAKPADQKFGVALVGDFATLILAVIGAVIVGLGMVSPPGATSVASPLTGGNNYVAHGGGQTLINYHHPNKAQAYALDIAEINVWGHQETLSSNLNDYEVFGKELVSPCNGKIIRTRDGLADNPPPNRDKDKANLTGNHVVIECQGLKILLAHMQKNSIAVKKDQTVTTGTPLGKIGNSGNTTQPHLHIHAVKADQDILKGEGIPLLIDGRYLVRNSIF